MTHSKTIVAVLTALLLTAPTLFADNINVLPGESIQDAIDNAEPGDRVVLRSGVHRENDIFVNTPDIEIVGQRAILAPEPFTVMDGGGPELGVGFRVSASNVTIRGIHFVGASPGILTSEDDDDGLGSDPILEAYFSSFEASPTPVFNLVVKNCRFTRCILPILAACYGNSHFEGNRFEACASPEPEGEFGFLEGAAVGAMTVIVEGKGGSDETVVYRNRFNKIIPGLALAAYAESGKVDADRNVAENVHGGFWFGNSGAFSNPFDGKGFDLPQLRVRRNSVSQVLRTWGIGVMGSNFDEVCDGCDGSESIPSLVGVFSIENNAVTRTAFSGILAIADGFFLSDGGSEFPVPLALTRNRVANVFGDGIVASGTGGKVGLFVESNVAALNNGHGFALGFEGDSFIFATENTSFRNLFNGFDSLYSFGFSGGELDSSDGDPNLIALVDNRVTHNGRDGVFARSSEVGVFDNRIEHNRGDGIDIDDNSEGDIEDNRIRRNGHHGISNSGLDANISDNVVTDNARGAHVDIAGAGDGAGTVGTFDGNTGTGDADETETLDFDWISDL